MDNIKKIAVLGGGSFGTVLANIAASNGNNVSLWVRDSEQALRINSEGANSTYHPELKLSSNIAASENLEEVLKDSDIILIATPSIIFENIVQRIVPLIEGGAHIISCTKGIKLDPFRSMSDIISMNVDLNINSVGVLSGPNLAREIAENKVAGTVIASTSNVLINCVKDVLSSDSFKVYSSNDIQGVELAGALKNIYAIICGMADAMGVGENAVGLILT
ncbi:NAD(P)-binding domain-containing protein, partial [Gammaproteobacteria bacterium]|nr:NAD(P)-binding domain-containing protein [Gammaproteobacteria bacterium]